MAALQDRGGVIRLVRGADSVLLTGAWGNVMAQAGVRRWTLRRAKGVQ